MYFLHFFLLVFLAFIGFIGMAKSVAIRFEIYSGRKWPNQEVPYRISPLYSSDERRVIENAIARFNTQVPCIKYRPASLLETDFVLIFPGESCDSNIGRQGGIQKLSLAKNGCMYQGKVIQQMTRTIGIGYEHTRPDRDEYIKIRWHNIPEEYHPQYEKFYDEFFKIVGPYDFYSIMHYPLVFPGNNKTAIEIKSRGVQKNRVGHGDELTDIDVDKINVLYC